MQAEVLVLDHDAAGLDRRRNVDRLRKIERRRVERVAQLPLRARSATKEMQSIGQMSTQASHSMQAGAEKTVWTSQLRQRCASASACSGSKPSSTSVAIFLSAMRVRPCGTLKRRSSVIALS